MAANGDGMMYVGDADGTRAASNLFKLFKMETGDDEEKKRRRGGGNRATDGRDNGSRKTWQARQAGQARPRPRSWVKGKKRWCQDEPRKAGPVQDQPSISRSGHHGPRVTSSRPCQPEPSLRADTCLGSIAGLRACFVSLASQIRLRSLPALTISGLRQGHRLEPD